jgi:hypothetical protein
MNINPRYLKEFAVSAICVSFGKFLSSLFIDLFPVYCYEYYGFS